MKDRFIYCGGNSFSALQLVEEFEFETGSNPTTLLGLLLKNSSFEECCADLAKMNKRNSKGRNRKDLKSGMSVVNKMMVTETDINKSTSKFILSESWNFHLGKCVDATPTLLELNKYEI